MFKRERGSGHFTIRHTPDYSPRRRIRPWAFISLAVAVVLFNPTGLLGRTKDSSAHQATIRQVQTTINTLCDGSWGIETLDRAAILATQLADQGQELQVAAQYLALLVEGTAPQTVEEQLLRELGVFLGVASRPSQVPKHQLDRYQKALEQVYNARAS